MNQFSADNNAHNWHIWVEENPHAVFSRAFEERFYINLWGDLLRNRVILTSSIEISLHVS
jgi:hypothetical protein